MRRNGGDNRLLERLNPAARAELGPEEIVQLAARTVLQGPATSAPYAYFPTTAVVSLVSTMESGGSAEVALVGFEGMVGLAGILGTVESPTAAVVQVAGAAVRVPTATVRAARASNVSVRETLDLYTEARLVQVAQMAACNRLHSVEARLARWLLAIHDRIDGNEIIAAHELIADMLGVHRPTVSLTLQRFVEQRVIGRRGRAIVIADRAGLEGLVCECYGVIERTFDALFMQPADSGHLRSTALPRSHAGVQAAATLEAMRDIAGRLLVANIREQEAREEAEAANRTKDDFLATVSHELRTPLNAILGWCNTLTAHKGQAVERGLAIIERNARAQLKLVDDLLDGARISSATLRIERTPVTLPQLVESAVETIRPAAAAKGVALRLSMAAQVPPLLADADRIRQVLLNVLTNALKFTDAGGSIEAQITAHTDHARVTIRDTGVGIGPAVLAHVFERFRQGGVSASHEGLGLGLAICRAIIELHGGSIELDSPGEGQGTTCTIDLPLASAQHELPRPAGTLST